MIPKIIHYCWFSGEEMPEVVKSCIASWHKYMPDYEYRLWDMDALRDIDSPFMREALECRKWAFAADYVRLWAVEKYGGIYIDSDVEILKPIDPFLSDKMFIGRESSATVLNYKPQKGLTSHIFGAEAHHPYLKSCLKYYDTRHFLITDDKELPEIFRYELRTLPVVQAVMASVGYGYDTSLRSEFIQHCSDGLIIYPSDVFDVVFPTKDSVARHLCLASWKPKQNVAPKVNKAPLPARLMKGSPKLKMKLFRLLNRFGYWFIRI